MRTRLPPYLARLQSRRYRELGLSGLLVVLPTSCERELSVFARLSALFRIMLPFQERVREMFLHIGHSQHTP